MAEDIPGMIRRKSLEIGVDPALSMAVAGIESNYDPEATSPTGVKGLFQVTLATGKQFGLTEKNRTDPEASAHAGISELKRLIDLNGGNIRKALTGYKGPEDLTYEDRTLARYAQLSQSVSDGDAGEIMKKSFIKNDPRQSIIDMEQTIQYNTPGGPTGTPPPLTPESRDSLFLSGVKRAESLDKTLNIGSGLQGYSTVLMKHMQEQQARPGEAAGPPNSLSPAADIQKANQVVRAKLIAEGHLSPTTGEPGYTKFFPQTSKEYGDLLVQTIKGVVIDPVSSFLELNKEVYNVAAKNVGATQFPSLFGISEKLNQNKSLVEWVDGVIGSPDTPMTGLGLMTRSLAGFIAPFIGISKAIGGLAPTIATATGSKVMGFIAKNAVSTAITDTLFVDPKSPTLLNITDELVRGVDPDGTEGTYALLTKTINGDLGIDLLTNHLTKRIVRAATDVPLGLVIDGIIGSVQIMRHGNAIRQAALIEEARIAETAQLRTETIARLKTEEAANAGRIVSKEVSQASRTAAETLRTAGETATQQKLQTTAEKVNAGVEAFAQRIRTNAEEAARTQQEATRNLDSRKLGQEARQIISERSLGAGTSATGYGIRELQPGATTEEVVAYQARVAAQRAALREEAVAATSADVIEPLAIKGKVGGFARWIDGLLDQVRAEEPIIKKTGKLSKAAPILPEPVSPALTHELAQQASEEQLTKDAQEIFTLLDKPVSETGLSQDTVDFLQKMRDAFGDGTGKAISAVVLNGGAAGLTGSEFLNGPEGGTEDVPLDRTLLQGASFLFLAGLGGRSLRGATQFLRSLRGEVAPEMRSLISGLKLSAAGSQRAPGQKLVENGVFRLDLVNHSGDLRELVHEVDRLVGVPKSTTVAGVNLLDDAAIAARLGIEPTRVTDLRYAAESPAKFAQRAAGLVTLAEHAPQGLKATAQRFLDGEPVGAELLKKFSIAGEIPNGFQTESRQFGASMNRFAEQGYGEFTQITSAGQGIGSREPSGVSMERLARQILTTPDGQLMAVANKMTHENGTQAIVQLYMNAILGTVVTPVQALIGNSVAMAWEIAERGVSSGILRAAEAVSNLTGRPVPNMFAREVGSPEAGEALIMLQSMFTGLGEMVQVGSRTALTGRTQFSEQGMTHSTGPGFTRNAFPRLAAGVDTAVEKFTGIENAGNVLTYIGSISEVLGSRALVVADEVASFGMERMNLAAREHRYIQQGAWKSDAERDAALAAFRVRPPDDVIEDTKRMKEVVTFMHNLLDPQGGFQWIRQVTGLFNQSMVENPAMRLHFPVLRGMTNMMTWAGERTFPLNLASTQFRNELVSSDPNIRARTQGRLVMSAMFAAGVISMGALGMSRGTLTTDKDYRAELEHAGRFPNSIDTPFGVMPLKTSQPLAWIVSTLSSIGMGARNDSTPEEVGAVHGVMLGLTELFRDQEILGAVWRLMDHLISPASDRKRVTQAARQGTMSMLAQTLDDTFLKNVLPPRIVQHVAQVLDPYKSVVDGFMEKVMARTPILSTWLTKETDLIGRPRYVGGGQSDSTVDNLQRVTTGVPIRDVQQDDFSKAMIAKGLSLNDPPAVLTVNHVSIPLSPEEQQKIRMYAANLNSKDGTPSLHDAILAETRKQSWIDSASGPGSVAAIMLGKVVESHVATARNKLRAEQGSTIPQRLIDRAKERKLPIIGGQ